MADAWIYFFRKGCDEQIQTRWVIALSKNASEGRISFKLNPMIAPFLINLKSNFTLIPYMKLAKLKSKYAIRLYCFLHQFRTTGIFLISIADLKNRFKLKNSYKKLENFKTRVIDIAVAEIQAVTEFKKIHIQYHKEYGRAYTAIKFTFDPVTLNSKGLTTVVQ